VGKVDSGQLAVDDDDDALEFGTDEERLGVAVQHSDYECDPPPSWAHVP
jgi:hypothetical protein